MSDLEVDVEVEVEQEQQEIPILFLHDVERHYLAVCHGAPDPADPRLRGLRGVTWEEYELEGGEYLGFARSHDVHGDGSIVIVPAPGHTPGSVIVFVVLPGGRRYAFVGDLAWQREGITEREERPWLQRTLADEDPAAVRAQLLRMAAIWARFPEITLVPAHDARGFADIPAL